MLLLPATLINKRYIPEHEEFHVCMHTKPTDQLTADAPSCLNG